MQHRNNSMLSFGDIMTNLMATMTLVCILMSAHAAQEHYANINMERYQGQQNQTVSPGASDLFLSITRKGAYILEGANRKGTDPVTSHAQAMEEIKAIMPTKLFLRVDREVNFGLAHQVFIDTTAMGIPVALAAQLP